MSANDLYNWLARHNEPMTDDMQFEKIDSYLSGLVVGWLTCGTVAVVFIFVLTAIR